MARIPKREEPYDNPGRQQRHYKTKRDQVLNSLKTAAHVGCFNYAVIFVNARGEPQTFASPLFEPKLASWFNPDVIADALELGLSQTGKKVEPAQDETSTGGPSMPGSPEDSKSTFPANALEYLGPDGVDDAYYVDAIQRMQQNTAKNIARCWIKIIEPKKQSRLPYLKGDDTKPSWWPQHVRHKEPDHIKAPERQALLIGILRSGVISITDLETKTFDTIRDMTPSKLEILREIFAVAKEDERIRGARQLGTDTPTTTASSSTLLSYGASDATIAATEDYSSSQSASCDEDPMEMMQGDPPQLAPSFFDSPERKPAFLDDSLAAMDQAQWLAALDVCGNGAPAHAVDSKPLPPESPERLIHSTPSRRPLEIQLSPERYHPYASSPLANRGPLSTQQHSRTASHEVNSEASPKKWNFPLPQSTGPHTRHHPSRNSLIFPTTEDDRGIAAPFFPRGSSVDETKNPPFQGIVPQQVTPRQARWSSNPLRRPNRPSFLELPERQPLKMEPQPSPAGFSTPNGDGTSSYVLTPDAHTPLGFYTGRSGDGYFDLTPGSNYGGSPMRMEGGPVLSAGGQNGMSYPGALLTFDQHSETPHAADGYFGQRSLSLTAQDFNPANYVQSNPPLGTAYSMPSIPIGSRMLNLQAPAEIVPSQNEASQNDASNGFVWLNWSGNSASNEATDPIEQSM